MEQRQGGESERAMIERARQHDPRLDAEPSEAVCNFEDKLLTCLKRLEAIHTEFVADLDELADRADDSDLLDRYEFWANTFDELRVPCALLKAIEIAKQS